MANIDNLANRIISGFNDCFTLISASKCSDFNSTHKIVISVSKEIHFPYISKNHIYVYASVIDFVGSFFGSFHRSHLVFCGSDDNTTFWKVV